MMMKCDHTSNYDSGGLKGRKKSGMGYEKKMKRLPSINLQN